MKTTKEEIKFGEINFDQLDGILSATIKEDRANKIATVLCMISAYTDDGQFNISFNAPSSTGKSYIPLEIAKFFPKEDLIILGNCSPTAFFHEQGVTNEETREITVDLSRKILIFTDQPGNQLLERLRSMLSHDQKEMHSKITDKITQGGNRTKNIIIKGFPCVVFCSAGLSLDEQESTRLLLLSPEMSQKKISRGISEKIRKETDSVHYRSELENNEGRKALRQRIEAIKKEQIKDVIIENPEQIEARYLMGRSILKARDQRDVSRLISMIKAITLLNLWNRDRYADYVYADAKDIEAGFQLWEKISASQELDLPPYVYDLFKDIVLPVWEKQNPSMKAGVNSVTKSGGITRQQIQQKHFEIFNKTIPDWQLRQDILPMLESSGLIAQEKPLFGDGRKMLIFPLRDIRVLQSYAPDSDKIEEIDLSAPENNSELDSVGQEDPDEVFK
jgi:hypothetical protein